MKMQATDVIIKAGKEFVLPVMVSKAGTTIHWVFHTTVYDIHFGIAKLNENNEREWVVANTPYPPSDPQQGKVVLENPGNYYLVWDNTYSWFHEKSVYYSIEIVMPEPTVDERVDCARYVLFTEMIS